MSEEQTLVPELRFPEFEEDGEWEEQYLGAIATFKSGGTPSKNIPEYWNGNIPWISASSMHEKLLNDSELRITEKAVKSGAKIVKKDTILILVRGSILFKRIPIGITARKIGRSSCKERD